MSAATETPLVRKLGIKDGSRVAVLGAPEGFLEGALGTLSGSASVRDRARGPVDVVLLFVRRRAELARRFRGAAAALDRAGGLWVIYPKKASGVASDLDFGVVQGIGLGAGLVDNKSAAVDEMWTGVRFVIRKEDRR